MFTFLGILAIVNVILIGLLIMGVRFPGIKKFFHPIAGNSSRTQEKKMRIFRKSKFIFAIICAIILSYPTIGFVYLHYFVMKLFLTLGEVARRFPFAFFGGGMIFMGILLLTFHERRKKERNRVLWKSLVCLDIMIIVTSISLITYKSWDFPKLLNARSREKCLKGNVEHRDGCSDHIQIYWDGLFCWEDVLQGRGCFIETLPDKK